MKTYTKKNLVLELEEDEIIFLRNITQNYFGNSEDETKKERELRIKFFVEASRALGYNMNDDGTIPRTVAKDISHY